MFKFIPDYRYKMNRMKELQEKFKHHKGWKKQEGEDNAQRIKRFVLECLEYAAEANAGPVFFKK